MRKVKPTGPAGLDTLVATLVFGEDCPRSVPDQSGPGETCDAWVYDYLSTAWSPLPFSTDIKCAWKIVDKELCEGAGFALISDDNGRWGVASDGVQNMPKPGSGVPLMTSFTIDDCILDPEKERAICLWALRDHDFFRDKEGEFDHKKFVKVVGQHLTSNQIRSLKKTRTDAR